jgi:hypothetical protein
MKTFFIHVYVLIAVFCFSYSYAADSIPIQTDCFDATLIYGTTQLCNGKIIHWVKVADFKVKDAVVTLRFKVQDASGLEKSGLLIPSDTINGHTINFPTKYIKFLVDVLHNEEVQFTTEYFNFY